MNDDELDRRLATTVSAERCDDSTLARLATATRVEATRVRARRRAVFGVGSIVALLGAAVASPVAADAIRTFLAQSDWHPDPGGEIVPDSDWVDVAAPDLPQYLDSIYPDYLVPAPGQSREQIVSAVAGLWTGREGLTQDVGLRLDMEIAVFCGWANEWTEAHRTGDEARANSAIDGMLLTTTWPAQAALNGGGMVERQVEIVGYASAGDVANFEFGVAQNNCSFATPALDGE